jgi:GxxExxY protein
VRLVYGIYGFVQLISESNLFLTKNTFAMKENQISQVFIGAAIEIHRALGPGLLESVYEKVLVYELLKRGLKIENQKGIPITYKELHIEDAFKADIIVEDKVVIELKSVEELRDVHYKQVSTYLKLSKLKLGVLINFNEAYLKEGVRRVVNGFKED